MRVCACLLLCVYMCFGEAVGSKRRVCACGRARWADFYRHTWTRELCVLLASTHEFLLQWKISTSIGPQRRRRQHCFSLYFSFLRGGDSTRPSLSFSRDVRGDATKMAGFSNFVGTTHAIAKIGNRIGRTLYADTSPNTPRTWLLGFVFAFIGAWCRWCACCCRS